MSARSLLGVFVIGAALAYTAAAPGLGQENEGPVDPPRTVTAHRYEVVVHDSAMDAIHDFGRTIVELWFPDAGIVCNLDGGVFEPDSMHAFYGASRHGLPRSVREALGDAAPPRDPPVEVQVPVALFERIRELADLTRQRREMERKLRADLAAGDLAAGDLFRVTGD